MSRKFKPVPGTLGSLRKDDVVCVQARVTAVYGFDGSARYDDAMELEIFGVDEKGEELQFGCVELTIEDLDARYVELKDRPLQVGDVCEAFVTKARITIQGFTEKSIIFTWNANTPEDAEDIAEKATFSNYYKRIEEEQN